MLRIFQMPQRTLSTKRSPPPKFLIIPSPLIRSELLDQGSCCSAIQTKPFCDRQGVLAIRRIFSLVDMIKKPKI